MRSKQITAGIRASLKKPLGDWLDKKTLIGRVREPLSRIISVGDITTLMLLGEGIRPDVAIIDYFCKRKPITGAQRRKLDAFRAHKLKAMNPAGMLTGGMMEACKSAFSPEAKYPLKIIVDGEEDLAVLPAIIFSPNNSLIIYGQPDKGPVLVKADGRQKRRARKFYKESVVVK